MMSKLLVRWVLVAAVYTSACIAPIASVMADDLAREVNRAFSKMGVGPEQFDDYTRLFNQFLNRRDSAVKRSMAHPGSDNVAALARKRIRVAAKKSVKQMRAVLSEEQIVYYEANLAAANKLYLRESGLR